MAGQLRERGESVAVVGVDDVAAMALPQLDWSWANEVHGHLVGAWLATPVRTVIAEGPSSPAEVAQLMRRVSNEVEVLTVVLVTPYEVALRRATSDADRGLSKDPGFLKADHDRFDHGRPELARDLALDGARTTSLALARRVIAALDARRGVNPEV